VLRGIRRWWRFSFGDCYFPEVVGKHAPLGIELDAFRLEEFSFLSEAVWCGRTFVASEIQVGRDNSMAWNFWGEWIFCKDACDGAGGFAVDEEGDVFVSSN